MSRESACPSYLFIRARVRKLQDFEPIDLRAKGDWQGPQGIWEHTRRISSRSRAGRVVPRHLSDEFAFIESTLRSERDLPLDLGVDTDRGEIGPYCRVPPIRQPHRHRLVFEHRVRQDWRSLLVIVQPDTVIRWHRRGFRAFWRRKSPRRARVRAVSPDQSTGQRPAAGVPGSAALVTRAIACSPGCYLSLLALFSP